MNVFYILQYQTKKDFKYIITKNNISIHFIVISLVFDLIHYYYKFCFLNILL